MESLFKTCERKKITFKLKSQKYNKFIINDLIVDFWVCTFFSLVYNKNTKVFTAKQLIKRKGGKG